MNILGMNIDWFKFLILLVIGLLVVGPEKLPSYARKTAKVIRNFQKVTSVLTGEISKALDMDDEDNKAPNFKKDLIAVKKSLEEDMAALKASIDVQAKSISETVESGTKDAVQSLNQNAQEISGTISGVTQDAAAPPAVKPGKKPKTTPPDGQTRADTPLSESPVVPPESVAGASDPEAEPRDASQSSGVELPTSADESITEVQPG